MTEIVFLVNFRQSLSLDAPDIHGRVQHELIASNAPAPDEILMAKEDAA